MFSGFAGCSEGLKPVDVRWGARRAAQRSAAQQHWPAARSQSLVKPAQRPAEEGGLLRFIHARGVNVGTKTPILLILEEVVAVGGGGVLPRLRLRIDFPDSGSMLSGADTLSCAVGYISSTFCCRSLV